MRNHTIYFSEFEMKELLSWCPQTAARHLPLVMWADRIHGDAQLPSSHSGVFELTSEKIVQMPYRFPYESLRHKDFTSLFLVRQGQGTHIIEGIPYGVARGDVYVMGRGMGHTFFHCDNLELDTFHFSLQVFDAATQDILTQTPGFHALLLEEPQRRATNQPFSQRWLHLTPDTYERIHQEVEELRQEWLSGTESGALLTRALFLRLLLHLSRIYMDSPSSLPQQQPSTRREAIIPVVVRYMDEHFTEPIRIEDLATMVFLSPDRFTEVFAEVMGRTPLNYLRFLRLERAKTLLRTTNLSIAEVAQEAGFREVAYFTRVFHSETGVPPGAYRKSAVTP